MHPPKVTINPTASPARDSWVHRTLEQDVMLFPHLVVKNLLIYRKWGKIQAIHA
jgi:hypothetical protein